MSRLEEYEKKCDEMKLQLAVSKERRQALEKQKEQYEKIISESCLELQEEANIAFVKLSERQRDIAKTKIEQLCTYAVQYIMGDNYESVIEIDVARSVPVANLFIKDKSTGLLSSPVEAKGGGIVDICASALRIIVCEIWTPKIDGPIIFDEAYKHVSKEYTPTVSEFLKSIVSDFGRQVVIATHNDFIAQGADRTIHVELRDGISVVTHNEAG